MRKGVEDIVVGLPDSVEQHHRGRRAADRFGYPRLPYYRGDTDEIGPSIEGFWRPRHLDADAADRLEPTGIAV